jgi:hypothetical protein
MLKKKTPILLHALQTLTIFCEGKKSQNSKPKSHFSPTLDEDNERKWMRAHV